MRKYFVTILLLYTQILQAQVESSHNIIFNDTASANRRVQHLHTIIDTTDGLSVKALATGLLQFATVLGTNNLSLTLPYNTALREGMVVYFIAGSTNTAPVTAAVNGSSFYQVKKKFNKDIDPAEIQPGQPVVMVFDGINFQVISKLFKPCKSGFVSVNDEYCIDSTARPASTFYNAVISCGNDNAMLCTWPQWYMACIDSASIGTSGYLSNFEWINDSGNNASDAKVVGYNDAAAYNGYGCKKSYSLPPTISTFSAAVETSGITLDIRFRCCYKK